jgi:hypothetical protein
MTDHDRQRPGEGTGRPRGSCAATMRSCARPS